MNPYIPWTTATIQQHAKDMQQKQQHAADLQKAILLAKGRE